MAKGFAIFRDPGNSETIGWKGHFSEPHQFSVHADGFYVQPWKRDAKGLFLDIESEERNSEMYFDWLNEVIYENSPSVELHTLHSFSNLIQFIKTGIAQGDFRKVVAGRSKFIPNSGASLQQIFEQACIDYPGAFVSLVYHPEYGCWFGASPERFIHQNKMQLETVALAGTLIGENKWTEKEYEEQTVVSAFFNDLFAQCDARNIRKLSIEETQQGKLKHLSEKMQFELPEKDAEGFIFSAHPTPAVGGYPQREAMAFIERFENTDRQWFAGWLGSVQNGVFSSWVNLRCARIYADRIQLFAGCGINSGSDVQKEWDETEAKMQVVGKYFIS